MMDSSAGFDRRIAERVRAARKAAGLTIEALAQRSGVSRAMISKIERAETSPTAALLARLSVGLQVTIGALLAEPERGALSRAGDGLPWRDPASGYLRRQVSPAGTGSPVEIVEVTFPPGRRVALAAWSGRVVDQHVWVFEGRLELTIGDVVHDLGPGDCLHMRLGPPLVYRNRTGAAVRYAVIITMREPA